MSDRSIRVTVRGAFDGLTAPQREELLARAGEHDFLRAAHTAEGHLSYDLAARPFFTFRFLVEAADDEDASVAGARGEQRARDWLDARGYGYRGIASTAVDPAQAPLGAKQRKAAARGR